MRSIQLSDVQEAVGQRQGAASELVDQLNQLQEGGERRRTGDRFPDVGRMDLAIGTLSVLLALLAWRRDRSKSRRELLDGAVFLALGLLERYVDMRQQSDR